jgi:serine/threonine-protein kinase
VNSTPRATDLAPDLPPAIDGFFVRALARDPSHRFQTIGEMVRELAAIVDVQRQDVPPPSVREVEESTDPADSVRTLAYRPRLGPASSRSGNVASAQAATVPSTLTGAGLGGNTSARTWASSRVVAALAVGAVAVLFGVVVSLSHLRGDGRPSSSASAGPEAAAPVAAEQVPAQPPAATVVTAPTSSRSAAVVPTEVPASSASAAVPPKPSLRKASTTSRTATPPKQDDDWLNRQH